MSTPALEREKGTAVLVLNRLYVTAALIPISLSGAERVATGEERGCD